VLPANLLAPVTTVPFPMVSADPPFNFLCVTSSNFPSWARRWTELLSWSVSPHCIQATAYWIGERQVRGSLQCEISTRLMTVMGLGCVMCEN